MTDAPATRFAGEHGVDLRIEGPHDLDTVEGPATLVRPPGSLSVTPPCWATPPVPLGTHEPLWP